MADYQSTLDKKSIINLIKPIAAVSDTVQLEVAEDGIRVCQVSRDKVALVSSVLYDGNARAGIVARVDAKRLTDAVGACGDSVGITISDTAVTVSDGIYTRVIRTLGSEELPIRVPRVEGEAVDITRIRDHIRHAVLGETISFAWGSEGVEIGGRDETGQAWLSLPCSMSSAGEATFSAKHLAGLIGAIPKDAEVKAYLKDAHPIRIDYEDGRIEGSILIAPIISEAE